MFQFRSPTRPAIALLAFFLVLPSQAPAQARLAMPPVTGAVRVVDADTLDLGADATVRLIGIDAAEGAQTCRDGAATVPCGRMATRAARALYEGRPARCAVEARDRYDRYLAVCHVDGVDVNADLVRRGLARTYRGDARYAAEQEEAIRRRAGLWAYEMQDPAAFRAAARQTRPDDAAAVAGDCPIKGNISSGGRIYHMPGQRDYDRTRIAVARGERWFCSEGEARAAGWRRARR